MRTLQSLQNHPEFNSIGKTEGFFCGQKTYLSFDTNLGWGLKRLNFIQQILRNAFGHFESTHLPAVFQEYSKLKIQQKFSQLLLDERIENAWNRHYLSMVGKQSIADRILGIKNYLSYNNNEGWSVKKLTFIQQFLRRNLAWYSSTFAHNVLLPWLGNRENIKHLSVDLQASISKLCAKKLQKLTAVVSCQ